MIDFVTYEFDSNLYDLYPNMPSGFAYTVKDVSGSNGIITRTLSCEDSMMNNLTLMRFGSDSASTDRELSLLKVLNINASNITSTAYMFANCSALTSLDLSGFDTSKVTTMASMFNGCTALTHLDLSGFDTSKVTTMVSMFANCSTLTSLDLSGFDTNKVTTMGYMFANCSTLTSLDLSSFDASNVDNMASMFSGCGLLTSIDLSGFDTGNATSMVNMFNGCSALTSLDLSSFDTSKVTNMGGMFGSCSSLTSLDLSSFDTSKVINMGGMFNGCSALTSLDLSSFDTSNVGNATSMVNMFNGCSALTSLDLSSFDTSKVTNMSSMFYGCGSLTFLNLSGFNTSNVTSMSSMFTNCNALTSLNLSGFDTSNVTNMSAMFSNCRALVSLDLSSFDTGSIINITNIFNGCKVLASIYMLKSNPNTINDVIYYIPTKDAVSYGEIFVSDNYDISLINIKDANIKNWNLVIITDAIDTSTIKNVSHQYMKITNIAFGLKNAIKKISMFSTDLAGDHKCEHEVYTGYPIIAEGDICEVHESYLMELYGNTIQDSNNLADIRSVGTLQSDGSYKVDLMISNPSKGRRMKSILLPQPLYSVKGYADRLFWDETTHRYYIEQNVIKIVLDESSAWFTNRADDTILSMYVNVEESYNLPRGTYRTDLICDSQPVIVAGSSNTNKIEGVGFNGNCFNIICDILISRLNEYRDPADEEHKPSFVRWVAENPLTIYYSIKEPIIVPTDITKQISFTAFEQSTQINTDEKEVMPSNMNVQIPIRKG